MTFRIEALGVEGVQIHIVGDSCELEQDSINSGGVLQCKIHTKWRYSIITEKWRRAYVYTPPGYNTARDKRYPATRCCTSHGGGEDETGWPRQGKLRFIMDNLSGGCERMLLVMDLG